MKKIDIIKECENACSIGITGHIRPDGDAIGSVMALKLYLKNVFPDKEIKAYFDAPPTIFSLIKEIDEVESDFPDHEPFDVFFVLDSVPTRISGAEKYFQNARKTINIDHHMSNANGSGDVNYVEAGASSTAELVYLLMDKQYVDRSIAEAIYIGMIHDTGVFKYSNTSPRTLRVAAELIEYGFDFPYIVDKTFYEKTIVQNRLLGRALLDAKLYMDGKVIVSCIDKETLAFYGAYPKHLDGIVSQLKVTRGVNLSVFFYELEEGHFKVSLRSDGSVNVSAIAVEFGGGGHERASGCEICGDYEGALEKILAAVKEQKKEWTC